MRAGKVALCRPVLCDLQAPYKTQLEPMLQQYVLPCFDAPAGHVRAKACWVTQQYADIKFTDGRGRGPTFMQLFQKTLDRLNDPELPVSHAAHPLHSSHDLDSYAYLHAHSDAPDAAVTCALELGVLNEQCQTGGLSTSASPNWSLAWC